MDNTAVTTPLSRQAARDPRGWLIDALTVFCGVSTAVATLFGLALGLVGLFSTAMVVVVAVTAGGLAIRVIDLGSPRMPDVATVGVLVVVLASVLTNGYFAGEHVLVDRDPAIYLTTGISLADEGDLQPDSDIADFGTAEGLAFSGAAHSFDGDEIEPAFLHGLSVLIAVGHGVAGSSVAVRVPAILGGIAALAFAAVLRRFTGPWWSVVGTVVVAFNLVHVWLFRDTYSETLTQPMLWAGFAMALMALERESVSASFLAGVAIAAAITSRLDTPVLLLIPAAVFVVALVPSRTKLALSMAAPMLIGYGLWWLDLTTVAGGYLDAHRSLVQKLGIASVALSLMIVFSDRVIGILVRNVAYRRIAGFGLGAIATLFAAAGLLRGVLTTPTRSSPAPSVLLAEQLSGLEPIGLRTYHEKSFEWMSWYLGWPLLGLAVVGTWWLAVSASQQRSTGQRAGLLGAMTVPLSLVYLWQPRAATDQLWVMRRYSALTLPLLILLATLGASFAVRRLAKGRVWLVIPLGFIAVAALTIPAAQTTAPMARLSMMDNYLGFVESVCDELPENAAVIAIAPPEGIDISAPALRSICEVGVGVLAASEIDSVPEIADAIRATGHQPVLVSRSRTVLVDAFPGLQIPDAITVSYEGHPEFTLFKPDQVFPNRFSSTVLVLRETSTP